MAERQKRLVLIDGHALAYRAYFGMPDTFSTQEGEKTNAVYGFMTYTDFRNKPSKGR